MRNLQHFNFAPAATAAAITTKDLIVAEAIVAAEALARNGDVPN